MHFNVNHTSQCDVKACVVPPSSSHTIQSSVHVHRKCRVGFMFTRSAEYGSCSQYRVVFTFTINMEQFSCSQKVLSIQLVSMNRSSALYNSCLQTELLRYVYKKQFKVVFMFTHSLLAKDFRTQLQLFYVSKMHLQAFPQMCVHQFKDKIWYGRSLDLIG